MNYNLYTLTLRLFVIFVKTESKIFHEEQICAQLGPKMLYNERGNSLNPDIVGIITMNAKEHSLKEKLEFHSKRRCALICELSQFIT